MSLPHEEGGETLGKRQRPDHGAGPAGLVAPPPPAPPLTDAAIERLRKRLNALSAAQLADMLVDALTSGALTEGGLLGSMPAPDLRAVGEELAAANRAITRALPNSRWGSSTDNYAYRRASSAVTAFKRLISLHAKAVEASGHWASVFAFCDLVVPELNGTITWDSPSHNTWQVTTAKMLDRITLKAAKAMAKEPTTGVEELETLVEEYGEAYPEIVQPVEAAVAKRQRTTK